MLQILSYMSLFKVLRRPNVNWLFIIVLESLQNLQTVDILIIYLPITQILST